MTDGILAEHRLSLSELANEQSVAIPTVWRWATRGIRGVRLETFHLGAKRFTTREAFARWVAATQIERDAPATPRTNRSRETAVHAAERELDAAGL